MNKKAKWLGAVILYASSKSHGNIILIIMLFFAGCSSSSSDNPLPINQEISIPLIQCAPERDAIFVLDNGTSFNLSQSLGIDVTNTDITKIPTYGTLTFDNEDVVYASDNNKLKIDSLSYLTTPDCGGQEFSVLIGASNSTIETTPIKYIDGGVALTELLDIEVNHCEPKFLVSLEPSSGSVDINIDTGGLIYSADLISKGIDTFSYRIECGESISDPIWINANANTVELTVPTVISLPAGGMTRLYFDNLINTVDTDSYSFEISMDGIIVGLLDEKYWEFTALEADTGVKELSISVFNEDKLRVASKRIDLQVYQVPDLSTIHSSILFIGDSLTASGYFVRAAKDMTDAGGLTHLDYLGTVEAQGVNFEGYGGNTWKLYNQVLSTKNPFLYEDSGLDFERYFAEELEGRIPEYVYIMLGVNDIFSKTDESYFEILISISSIFITAEQFVTALKLAVPEVKIIVGSITPPNMREEAFIDDYGADIRRRYRNVQHIFVEQQELHFSGKEAENIFFLPLWHNLDTASGYPIDNALHPNALGYDEMATSFFNGFVRLLR